MSVYFPCNAEESAIFRHKVLPTVKKADFDPTR